MTAEETRKKALSLLERRDYGSEELCAKLVEKGAEPDEARAAVRYMVRVGFIDDERYAAMVVRHYAAKGYGPRKIQDELYRRGVPREFWADALVQSESQAGQLDELVSKRMRGEEPTRENLKRTSDYLARRGFSWEEISAALERYRGEPGE